MKTWFLACLMMVAPLAFADGHGDLGLEKRQPDTAMNVTSVVLGQDVTSVSAEGDMEGYGKVYVTYELSYNAARKWCLNWQRARISAILTDWSAKH